LLGQANKVVELTFRDAAVDGGEMTLWVRLALGQQRRKRDGVAHIGGIACGPAGVDARTLLAYPSKNDIKIYRTIAVAHSETTQRSVFLGD
jgi:hypothetical protein